MDRTRVCGTRDIGSIPIEGTLKVWKAERGGLFFGFKKDGLFANYIFMV